MAVAVRVTLFVPLTDTVLMVNVTLVLPAGIVTLAGTVTAGSALVKKTTIAPGPAGASSVTVPVDDCPPFTELGLSVNESGPIGRIERGELTVTPFRVAEILAVNVLATAEVVTMKDTFLFPARIVTVVGTVAAVLSLLTAITVSTEAIPFRDTVATEVLDPSTVEGFRLRYEGTSGLMESVLVVDLPLAVAVSVTVLSVLTG